MKNFPQKFIGILALVFAMSFTVNAQENYSFDFSYGNYGRIPTSETLSNFESFTMEFWYYLEAGHGSDENIVGTELQAGNGFHIYTFQNKLWPYIGDGSSSIGPYNGGPVQGEPYNLNEWYHISYCYDGVDFKFFIDGELVYFESGIINTFGPLNKDIVINRHTWGYGSSSRLTGQIDELRISNISRYYDDFIPPTQEFVPDEFTAGLWHFNNDFNDYSGNNNHGIHVGTSFSENTPIVVNGCTNSSALNYDNFANTDDGSCIIFLGNNDTSYFYISPTPLTWEESNNLSISYDAHLATITSQEENDFITNLISQMELVHAFWLGAIDLNGNNDFQWVTGEDFNYTNWNGSEPQPGNDELYLNIWGVNANSNEVLGKWNDYDIFGHDAEPHTHALIEVRIPTEFNVPSDFSTIQQAIDISNHGDTVFVQSGTYNENLNLNGKNITLIGEDKLTTIIEAEDADSRTVTFNSGENNNCVLSGFTLSNSQYGAISVEGSSPTLENLIIKGNSANDGGGIYVNASQGLIINNCELSENSSTGHGGGLSIWYDSDVVLSNSNIKDNTSETGGGIYSFNSSLEINYSIINSNQSTVSGGGITISSTSNSNLNMANTTMYDNFSITIPQSNSIVLAENDGIATASITNSIIWEKISGDNFSITYSNIQGQGDDNFEIYPGEGNIAQISLFNSVDSSNPDYNLTVCSPCIDAGNPEETDPDGSIIDMGALPFITQGYNCDGNIDVEIGDEVFGGVVFYVGEGSDGQYGLVASTDYIGTGTWQQAFDQSASYENNGYTDWYLPYMHELSMIYNELHSTGSNVYNTGDVNNWYWSSEVCDSSSSASDVHFTDGSYNLCNNMSSSMGGVLAIHSFGQVAYGCIDSLAFNFNTETNLDDGSCYPVIEGCLDTTAFNYTQTTDDVQIDVNTDDGSCYDFIFGCLDTESFNFNDIDGDGQPNALTGINGIDINTDDGSCYPVIEGCLDTTAFNYAQPTDDVQIDVNTDDGSCYAFVYGCLDTESFNFNDIDGDGLPNALTGINGIDINTDDGSCYPVIEGCMNSIAENYITPIENLQIDVNTDNGSCLFSAQVFDNLTTTNSNLEEELSVFETVEEAQDYSMNFDGIDDYIRIEHNEMFNLLNNMTVMAWVKLSENQNDHNTIIAKRDDSIHPNGNHPWQLTTSIEYPQNQAMFCSAKNNSYTYSYSITPIFDYYQWVNIASVVEGDSVKLYKNGVYISTAYFPVSNRTENNFDILIGSVGRSNAEYFMGELDDILLFDIALSDNEVQSFISCPPSGNEEGLVGYWNFNEGLGDTVYDISGNGNHGIINGAEFSEDVPESYNGCTDSNALNYDESALCDNGSCVFGDELVTGLEAENSNLEDELSVFETVEIAQDYSLKLNDSQVLISDNLTYSSNNGLSFLLNVKMINLNQQHFIDIGEAIGVENYLRYVVKYENGLIQAWMEGPGWGSNGGQSHLNYEIEGLSDEWIKIGVTFNNTASKLYVDGILVDTKEYTYSENIQIVSSPNSIISGNNFQSEGYRFNGLIEDLQIWGNTLSNDEIQSYMTCPPTGNEEDLVGYWNFNEGIGNTVYDLSGNGNNGVIYEGYIGEQNNAEYSEDVPESYDGCTDENALNYDESALCDNGSCVYGDDVVSNLEEDLSVFETVEEEQDYSMSFNGVDDYIFLSADVLPIAERTISIWFNSQDELSSSRILMSYGGGACGTSFNIGFNNLCSSSGLNTIEFQGHCNANVITYDHQNSIELNTWYHLTFTSNELGSFVYLNGELVVETSVISSNYVDGKDFIIGGATSPSGTGYFTDGCSQPWLGNIDNPQIWSKYLSQEEIQTYMSCPPTGEEDGLVGFWNFNEGVGDTVYDLSGNGNHGIINSATFTEDVPESYNGCTDVNALNFDESALCDNGSCVYGEELVASLEDENSDLEESFNQTVSALNNDLDSTSSTLNEVIDTWQSSIDLTTSTLDEVSLINQTLSSFNTAIDLSEGWNMIGYGCPEPIDLVEGLSNYTEIVIIVKDNNGDAYLPEWNFNGIGDFTPGFGYQLKISESIEGFSLCGDFTAIDNTQITTIEDNNTQMQNDINCLTGNPEIGDHCYGGIVFYVEEGEYGKYGLVASNEDIAVVPFGCYGEGNIEGANGIEIGTGYQNTLDIVSGCSETPIGASLALAFEANGFDDWYIPSQNELNLMYTTIGNSSSSNIGEFIDGYYWSSTQYGSGSGYDLDFTNGVACDNCYDNNYANRSRPIRAFGNWAMGCMDSLACNFNTEANMSDGSCTYAEDGYDCDGNLNTSLSFNGIDEYILVSNVSLPYQNNDRSILFHSKHTSNSNAESGDNAGNVISYGLGCSECINNRFSVLIKNDSREVEIVGQSNDINTGVFLDSNTWTHIAVILEESILKIYKNGVLEASFNNSYNTAIDSNLFIGKNTIDRNDEYLGANLSHLQIWDKALSIEEIQTYKNCFPNNNEDGLIGYWNFNEGEGETVYDLSGNGNHGTINGASYSTDTPESNCE